MSNTTQCALCAIAVAFLLTSIVIPFVSRAKSQQHTNLHDTLNDEQQKRYERIVGHRRNLYLQGLVVGLLVACFVVGVIMQTHPLLTNTSYGCIAVIVLFVTEFLYYILSPKGEYMIDVLDSAEQRRAWMDVYRHMQVSMYGSFACALVASFLLFTFGLDCSVDVRGVQ